MLHLSKLDYSVVQQCMHCGMCLPTCPTYDLTKHERHSPRGRIRLMRSIADGELEISKTFADEMYYCLGCLACATACPAGVDYPKLFEAARADAEEAGVLASPKRNVIRSLLLRTLFTSPNLLRLAGRLLWLTQVTGLHAFARKTGLTRLLPKKIRQLEPQTPRVESRFSHQLIEPNTEPKGAKYRVALLTGCVQDLLFASVNRDTAEVLAANGCEVITPQIQYCCGSLHAHNGELPTAKALARKQIDMIPPERFDAIITNAAGCGSHLKTYDHLLHDDPAYAEQAKLWSRKVRDIHEWLAETGIRPPQNTQPARRVTYHEACHLCHGQKIMAQPRQVLRAIPNLELIELPESTWCCGSAGVYNITQPETAAVLQERKAAKILETGADIVTTGNPGCLLQLINGLKEKNPSMRVCHPVSLLAEAYRNPE